MKKMAQLLIALIIVSASTIASLYVLRQFSVDLTDW